MRFSYDGYYLAVGGNNPNVIILNAYEPFGLNRTINPNVGNPVNGLDFSKDSSKFVACGGTGSGNLNYLTVNHINAWVNVFSTPFNTIQPGGTATDCRISLFDGKLSVTNSQRVTFFDSSGSILNTYSPSSTTFTKNVFDPLSNFFLFINANSNRFSRLNVATGSVSVIQSSTGTLNAVDIA